MNANGGRNEWFSPGVILGLVGMAAAFGSFCISFDRRISHVESAAEAINVRIAERDMAAQQYRAESRASLETISNKLDRLVERGRK